MIEPVVQARFVIKLGPARLEVGALVIAGATCKFGADPEHFTRLRPDDAVHPLSYSITRSDSTIY